MPSQNESKAWEEIFNRINTVIEKIENHQGEEGKYRPPPEAIAEAIEELLEIRLLLPGSQKPHQESAD